MTARPDGHDQPVSQDSQIDHDILEVRKEELEKQLTSPVTSIERRNHTGTEHQRLDASTIGQATQNARTTIPTEWAIAMDHIVADLRISKAEAVREAIGLFLRFHGRGQGIPEPLPPVGRH